MKRGILIAAGFAVLFGLPMTAKAVVIGSITMNADGTLGSGWTMSELKGATVTDLSTFITKVGDPMFFRRGNTIYYSRTDGVAKQVIGGAASSLVKKMSNYAIITSQKTTYVISDLSTSKTAKGSYLLNTSTKKVTRFAPKIGALTQAGIASNGKWLALLTKNSKKKPLLYVSSLGHLEALNVVALPKSTSSCATLAIAPDNASLALVCDFKQASGSTASGILLGTYANGAVKLATKPYYDNTFLDNAIVWTTANKLVAVGFGVSTAAGSLSHNIFSQGVPVRLQTTPLFVSAIHAYSVKNRAVTKLVKKEFDTSAISTDPNTIFLPLQVTRVDSNTVMFMSFIMASDAAGNVTSVTSYIGSYSLLTSMHNILLNNGKLNVLGDAAVSSS